MVGTTDKIYVNQTSLQIRLRVYEDLSASCERALIKYRKPNGFEGYWEAEIVDPANGVIAFTVEAGGEGLDDSGFWTIWAYLYYKDGTVTSGDAVQIGVYQEGKTYIAFPYGQNSIAGETQMAQEAFEILYNNTTSGLVATNVQDAIDEIKAMVTLISSPTAVGVSFDNTHSGLPASDVQVAIDKSYDAVTRLISILEQTNKTLYVDMNRTDLTTPEQFGSIQQPFLTITQAVLVATPGTTIYVASGVYPEDLTLPDYVSMHGNGIGATVLGGQLRTGLATCSIKDMTVGGDLYIRGQCSVYDVIANGLTYISAGLVAHNFSMLPTVPGIALTVSGASVVRLESGAIESGDSSAIRQTNGTLYLTSMDVQSAGSSSPTILATTSRTRIMHSNVRNNVGPDAISINNGATASDANILSQVVVHGAIDCGTAFTIQDGVFPASPLSMTGTNFIKRTADEIAYDGTTAGLDSTDLQSALDRMWSSCKAAAGPPPPGPVADWPGQLYFDTTARVLYVSDSALVYQSFRHSYIGYGSINLSGNAAYEIGVGYSGSGVADLSGNASYFQTAQNTYTMVGGAALSGAAPTIAADYAYSYIGSGSALTLSGAASTIEFLILVSGGFSLLGSALTSSTSEYSYVGSYGITLSGASDHTLEYSYFGNGGFSVFGPYYYLGNPAAVTISGSALYERYTSDYIYSGFGETHFIGAASYQFDNMFNYTGSGEMSISDTAITTQTRDYYYTGSGGVGQLG